MSGFNLIWLRDHGCAHLLCHLINLPFWSIFQVYSMVGLLLGIFQPV